MELQRQNTAETPISEPVNIPNFFVSSTAESSAASSYTSSDDSTTVYVNMQDLKSGSNRSKPLLQKDVQKETQINNKSDKDSSLEKGGKMETLPNEDFENNVDDTGDRTTTNSANSPVPWSSSEITTGHPSNPLTDTETYSVGRSSGVKKIMQIKRKQILSWVRLIWPIPLFPTNTEIAAALTLPYRSDTLPFMVAVQEKHKTKTLIQTIVVTEVTTDNEGRLIPHLSSSFYEPREFLLSQCPLWRRLPIRSDDSYEPWDEKFLLNKVLLKLGEEALAVQSRPALFLTVREAILLDMSYCEIFQCRLCSVDLMSHDVAHSHLKGEDHGVTEIYDDELFLRVDPLAYIKAFFTKLPAAKTC